MTNEFFMQIEPTWNYNFINGEFLKKVGQAQVIKTLLSYKFKDFFFLFYSFPFDLPKQTVSIKHSITIYKEFS